MARYVATVPTSWSAEQAFAFMSDMRRFPEWDPGVREVVQVVGEGPGPGAVYDLTVAAVGTTTMRYEVRAFEAPRRVLLVSTTPWLSSVDEVRVEPAPGGAVVVYDAVLTLNGPLRLFDVLLRVAFRWIGGRAEAGMRRRLAGVPS
jgi:hypothetical protein